MKYLAIPLLALALIGCEAVDKGKDVVWGKVADRVNDYCDSRDPGRNDALIDFLNGRLRDAGAKGELTGNALACD